LYTRFSQTNNPAADLGNLGRELEIAYRRTLGQAHRYLNELLETYRPKVAGIIHPIRNMNDVVRAAYGETTNRAAKEMAEEVANAFEFLRKSMNMYGASVPPNPNRRIPQSHDRLKVSK